MTDVHGMITALYAERERIDRVISRLERRALALLPRNPQNLNRQLFSMQQDLETVRRSTREYKKSIPRMRDLTESVQ